MEDIISRTKRYILDLFFPKACIGCKLRGESLCDSCILYIRKAERETRKDIYACFDYRDPVIRKAIWDLKYHRLSHLGQKLGQLMYETFMEELSEMRMYSKGQPLLIIPVPLSRTKARLRGYNQTKSIAEGLSRSSSKEIFEIGNNIVKKKINTKPQARIANRMKRLENVRGVFEIKKSDRVRGRTIIVIDDVTTTGGTMNEMIKILKRAGAKKVVGFAVAH